MFRKKKESLVKNNYRNKEKLSFEMKSKHLFKNADTITSITVLFDLQGTITRMLPQITLDRA